MVIVILTNKVGARVGGSQPAGLHRSSGERSRLRTPGFDPVVRRMHTPPPAGRPLVRALGPLPLLELYVVLANL